MHYPASSHRSTNQIKEASISKNTTTTSAACHYLDHPHIPLPSPPLSTASLLTSPDHSHDPWVETHSSTSSLQNTSSRSTSLVSPVPSNSSAASIPVHLVGAPGRRREMDGSLAGIEGSWRMDGSELRKPRKDLVWDIRRPDSIMDDTRYPNTLNNPDNMGSFNHLGGSKHDNLDMPSSSSWSKDCSKSSSPGRDERDGKNIRDGKRVRRGPLPTAVWVSIMDTSKGRDKVLVSFTSTPRVDFFHLGLR